MNTGGPASEKTLLDEFAGQALAGLYGAANEQSYKLSRDGHPSIKRDDVAKDCYSMASAMLAEKARREADHSGDANKMVPNSPKQHDACALLRKFVDEIEGSDCSGDLWSLRREAISLLDQATDHSPDAGKMVEINRELVEALEACEAAFSKFAPQEESAYGMAWIKVRAAIAKSKEVA